MEFYLPYAQNLPRSSVGQAKRQIWLNSFTPSIPASALQRMSPSGEIGVEELADVLSEIFDVEIKNCYNVYMNMKRRKDDSRTYFLDELREKLNKRMMESDLKGGKYKKR